MDYMNSNISFRAKPIPKTVINKTKQELLNPKVSTVDIYCHTSADEDTINSAKVFGNWLISKGKEVNICVAEKDTKDLYFNSKDYNIKQNHKPANKSVILDFNAKERLPQIYSTVYEKTKANNIIGYDHHKSGDNKLKGKFYIDDSAKSCCGVLTRFFDGLGEKLNKKDTKSLFCGMVSDYKKSELLKITNNKGKYTVIKTDKLLQDKNSLEVFEKLENSLSKREKTDIYKHLDPLSRLTNEEKMLRKHLFENIHVSKNGKLAYVAIPPNDKLWKKVGMDTSATSEILKELRVKVSTNDFNIELLNDKQKEKLKNVDTVIAFYRKSSDTNEYRMSIHSRSNSAIKLIERAKEMNSDITAGGHADRAGGFINSIEEKDTKNFIRAFVKASEILE